MSNKPKINTYANLRTLARKLRDDLGGVDEPMLAVEHVVELLDVALVERGQRAQALGSSFGIAQADREREVDEPPGLPVDGARRGPAGRVVLPGAPDVEGFGQGSPEGLR